MSPNYFQQLKEQVSGGSSYFDELKKSVGTTPNYFDSLRQAVQNPPKFVSEETPVIKSVLEAKKKMETEGIGKKLVDTAKAIPETFMSLLEPLKFLDHRSQAGPRPRSVAHNHLHHPRW